MLYVKENGFWVKASSENLAGQMFLFRKLSPKTRVSYVSFGDSIAAGHAINDDWDADYGVGSQYGKNGNQSTAIVPQCYTDLIRKELVDIYGEDCVTATSFAKSGDKVEDLIEMLDHAVVRSAVEQADIVTICIGANDILGPALSHLEEYILAGDLSAVEQEVAANMVRLNDDTADDTIMSFLTLFNKLSGINKKAKYVFTTVYNPYKYLYLHTGVNGFFGPLLEAIPTMVIDVDKVIEDMFGIDDLGYWNIAKWRWESIDLSLDLGALIKEGLLGTPIVQRLFDRVNNVGPWAENYVTQLNDILRNKVNGYLATNQNFAVAETKELFDLFPDKSETKDDVDYSDLVNVEFTRTYDTAKMNWGALWTGSDAATFWTNLAWKYLSFTNALPSTELWDYVNFNLEAFAEDLVTQTIEKVIRPDVDPHPEKDGHSVLKLSFANVVSFVKYEANGSECVPGDVLLAQRENNLAESDGWYLDEELTQEVNVGELTGFTKKFTLEDLVSNGSIKEEPPKTTTLYSKGDNPEVM